MYAADLGDDDLGKFFWIQTASPQDWVRLQFLGRTRRPDPTVSRKNGGHPHFVILICPSTTAGAIPFRTTENCVFYGLLVLSTADVVLVDVDYAVCEDGSIIELGERAA